MVPDPSLIIGWGNAAQKAGHSPGRSSDGTPATGLLIDESSWTWNLDGQNNHFSGLSGDRPNETYSRMLYANIYAEHTEPVYFIGRLYRTEPGVG